LCYPASAFRIKYQIAASLFIFSALYHFNLLLFFGEFNLSENVSCFYKHHKCLGALLERRPQSMGDGVIQCGHFASRRREASDANVCSFWCIKLRFFFRNLGYPHGEGGLSQYGIFRKGVIFFAVLCGRLYRRPLF